MTDIRIITLAGALALGAFGTPAVGHEAYDGKGAYFLDTSEIEWSEVGSMAPPAKIAVLEGNPGKEEPFTFRLLLPAGYEIDPHDHPAYERVTVISGTLYFAHGEEFDRDAATALPAGSYAVLPPEAPMYGYVEEETVIQVHGTGPWGIDYLHPEHDPRR
ncbi:cupin domain-containing protein [Spiribacter halobius]|uniref:Cupin n=1 Tax=Sediminicurvatus halobius TaxID=2182432 RepID=A0A2U2N4P0_9GAMM|nr:cupin domain-containing protein [Spiribacter halobius]PWG63954.1 cupin [Spiribacter halobius]UEX76370.1 cupin domain-containing protein [Spiribacter halobius]